LAAKLHPVSYSKNDVTVRSSDPVFVRRSDGIFRLFLTVQNLFDCFDLAVNAAFQFQNLGFSRVLTRSVVRSF
jgi:hypothetical protein